jgi:hypothetical protein
MKVCSKCNRELHESEFYKSNRYLDGLRPSCKHCQKLYYESNKEYILQRHSEYAQTPEGKDANRRAVKKYRQTDNGKQAVARVNHKHRGFGTEPLNEWFEGAHFHHLHINNDSEGVYIPESLHMSIPHNSYTWEGMDAMNIIALLYLHFQTQSYYRNVQLSAY